MRYHRRSWLRWLRKVIITRVQWQHTIKEGTCSTMTERMMCNSKGYSYNPWLYNSLLLGLSGCNTSSSLLESHCDGYFWVLRISSLPGPLLLLISRCSVHMCAASWLCLLVQLYFVDPRHSFLDSIIQSVVQSMDQSIVHCPGFTPTLKPVVKWYECSRLSGATSNSSKEVEFTLCVLCSPHSQQLEVIDPYSQTSSMPCIVLFCLGSPSSCGTWIKSWSLPSDTFSASPSSNKVRSHGRKMAV
jgi:hypothetical protein